MKRMLVLAIMVIFASCNSNNSAKTDTMASPKDSAAMSITSPFPIQYSSDFAMGNPKNAEDLLTLWKDWGNGDLSVHKNLFADSVEMHFADGSVIHTSRDSAIAFAQSFRNTLASAAITVDAIMPAKSIDKNENWALIWAKEVDTDKQGKIDSSYLQETWRFNKDGKADLFYQYKSAAAPPKK